MSYVPGLDMCSKNSCSFTRRIKIEIRIQLTLKSKLNLNRNFIKSLNIHLGTNTNNRVLQEYMV